MKKLLKNMRLMQSGIMGMNQRNIELIYPNNRRTDYKYADDKCLAKELLTTHNIRCPRTYGVLESMADIETVWNRVSVYDTLVIKPSRGSGGNGILILKKKGKQWFSGDTAFTVTRILEHMANTLFGIYSLGDTDKVLIEEYVTPHSFFSSLYHRGVPDFRVILLHNIPLMSMLRMPTAKSGGKANLHQGGLGIGIDMEKGRLSHAYDGKKHLDAHPDSGNRINGVPVPFWDELLELSIQASRVFPLNYLGVDLVVDAVRGPMVMEVNVRPGLGIQLANKKGLKEVINNLIIQ